MDNPELEGVEKTAIAWLVKLGYTHLSGNDVGHQQAHRHMAPILEDVLAEQLLRLNPWLATLQKESCNSPPSCGNCANSGRRTCWKRTRTPGRR